MTDSDSDSPPDPERPSPFAEWAPQPEPAPPATPPPATPPPATPLPATPPQVRPSSPEPAAPGPASTYAGPGHPQPPPGFYPRPTPPPVFPPAPPGLYPTPDDPLVSADFSGWWRRSIALFKAIWRPAALVQLLWLVPMLLAGLLGALLLADDFTALVDTPSGVEPDWQPFLQSLYFVVPLGLLTALLALLASLTTLHLVVQAALRRPLSIRVALRAAAPRIPAYIGWGLLGGLATLAGFVCCILPGYYVAIVLTIMPTVVLLERGNAVARCFRLFHARPGDALGRLGTMIGLGLAVSTVEQIVLGLAGTSFGLFSTDGVSPVGFAVLTALAVVFSGASQVLLAPFHVATYADMRARREPFSTAYLTS